MPDLNVSELIHLGVMSLNDRHPESIILRYTHNLHLFYRSLQCGVPDDFGKPCPRPVIGVLGEAAYCAVHQESDTTIYLYIQKGMNSVYKMMRCSIPAPDAPTQRLYGDCREPVIGVYKDTAFCRRHAWYAKERRYSYPWNVEVDD